MNELLERLLKIGEGLKDLRKLYVESGKISQEVFDELSSYDISKSKKYVGWMVREYIKNPSIQDRPRHLRDVIQLFNTLQQKNLIDKDIYKFGLDELEQKMAGVSSKGAKSKSEITRVTKEEGAEQVLETNKVLVLRLDNYEACKLYGMHTKWCITGKGYWDQYTARGIRFYFVIDKIKNKKYAVAVYLSGEKEVYDEKDKKVPFKRIQSLLSKNE